MKTRRLVAALAAALALPAFAGEAPRAEKHVEKLELQFDTDLILADALGAHKSADEWSAFGDHMRAWAQDFTYEMQGSMAYMFSDRVGRGKVVKGAPYSAEIVTEMNQALTDGNVITHRNVNRVYRDGEGRTRQETYRGEVLRSVYIGDPVAGTNYTLLPGSKIAVSVPRISIAPRARTSSSKSSSETQSSDGERKIVVRTVEGRDGAPGTREEVRVQVVRMGEGEAPVPPVPPVPPRLPHSPNIAPSPPIPPIPPIPGVHTMRFESTSHLGKGVTTKLGTKDFDGVKAEGVSTVWTIPAGQIGNRNPINVTKEAWYAPDLQVMVYSRHNDPRTGESIYRLAGIKRAEPAADLFKVPEGYATKGRGKAAAPSASGANAPG